MEEFWNERYAEDSFAYGELPNEFFKTQLDKLKPGKILLPAEGEGRNAVYAARKGWSVRAFDISKFGKQKAERLASSHNVTIEYNVGPLAAQSCQPSSFDVIALIFAHFPPHLKREYHLEFVNLLKPGGVMIFEAFSKDHLRYSERNPSVGGPKNIDILYDRYELKEYFKALDEQLLLQTEVDLSEGKYHQGIGSVVRFVGTKK